MVTGVWGGYRGMGWLPPPPDINIIVTNIYQNKSIMSINYVNKLITGVGVVTGSGVGAPTPRYQHNCH